MPPAHTKKGRRSLTGLCPFSLAGLKERLNFVQVIAQRREEDGEPATDKGR